MLPQALGLAQQLPAVGAGVSLESGLEIAGDVYLVLTDVNRSRDAGLLECVLAAQEHPALLGDGRTAVDTAAPIWAT